VSGPRLARAAACATLLAAAAPAAAFVRSTTAEPQDPTKGLCLWWASPVISFVVNTAGYQGNCGAAGALARVRASFETWNNRSCSSLRFDFAGEDTSGTPAFGNDGRNLVIFRKGTCGGAIAGDPNNCWSRSEATTIAITTTTFDANTGQIFDADMEIRSWSGSNAGSAIPRSATSADGFYFTCDVTPTICQTYGQPPTCMFMDIGTTVTHEAGHVLGLDHVCAYPADPGGSCPSLSVMNTTAGIGEVHRTLAADDVNGVCAIYPAGQGPSRTNGCLGTGAPPQRAGGGGGCATGGAGALGLVGLALARLRRRAARG
jgi:hypothetical protein